MFRELSEMLTADRGTFPRRPPQVVEFPRLFVPRLHSCCRSSTCMLKGLICHLDDEEDLMVPLILDRGEVAFRVAQHN